MTSDQCLYSTSGDSEYIKCQYASTEVATFNFLHSVHITIKAYNKNLSGVKHAHAFSISGCKPLLVPDHNSLILAHLQYPTAIPGVQDVLNKWWLNQQVTENQDKLNTGDEIYMYETFYSLKLGSKTKNLGTFGNTIGAVAMRGLYTQNQITEPSGGSSLAGKSSPCSPDAEQISLKKYGNC